MREIWKYFIQPIIPVDNQMIFVSLKKLSSILDPEDPDYGTFAFSLHLRSLISLQISYSMRFSM